MKWQLTNLFKKLNLYKYVRMLWLLYDRLHFIRRIQERRFYSQIVNTGDLVFDIGACFGGKTSIFLKLGAQVVAVEPTKACLTQLYHEFSKTLQVTIVPRGAAQKKGFALLTVCPEEPAISTMNTSWVKSSRFKDFTWRDSYRVPVTTLDTLIKKYGQPQFCKIDVEGFELSVLKGLHQPIRCLSFEFTQEFIENALACLEHLATLGHARYNYTVYDALRWGLTKWVPHISMHRELQQLTDPYLWGDVYARFNF